MGRDGRGRDRRTAEPGGHLGVRAGADACDVGCRRPMRRGLQRGPDRGCGRCERCDSVQHGVGGTIQLCAPWCRRCPWGGAGVLGVVDDGVPKKPDTPRLRHPCSWARPPSRPTSRAFSPSSPSQTECTSRFSCTTRNHDLTAALPERRRNRPIARAAESATSGSSRSGPQCSRLAQVKDAALTEKSCAW